MKLTLNSKQLLNAMAIASKGINPNVVIPILENFLFDISPESLSISGSNQEGYICKTIACTADGSLKIAMPKEVYEQVKLLPEQPLIFEIDNLQVTIKSAGGVYKLSAEDGNDFPGIKNTAKSELQIDGKSFQSALSKTAFCVLNNSVPTPFDGLDISLTPGQMTLTAYGNNTLSTQSITYNGEITKDILLTKKTVDILQTTEFGESIEVKFDKNSVDFIIDDTLFIRSVLLDMKFPDFKQNVTLDQDKCLVIDADVLRRACEVTRVMANKYSFLIGLFLSQKGSLVKATDKDFGRDAKEEIDGDYSGGDFVIGVNGNFMITALSKLSGVVYLYFSESTKPIFIREQADNSELTNLILVMPVNIEI